MLHGAGEAQAIVHKWVELSGEHALLVGEPFELLPAVGRRPLLGFTWQGAGWPGMKWAGRIARGQRP